MDKTNKFLHIGIGQMCMHMTWRPHGIVSDKYRVAENTAAISVVPGQIKGCTVCIIRSAFGIQHISYESFCLTMVALTVL